MVGPWVSFVFSGAVALLKPEEEDVGDIEYLATKEFDGKLRENAGTLSAAGTLATLTATSGKDMYLAKAKVILHRLNVNQNAENADVDLVINGLVQETAILTTNQPATGGGGTGTTIYEFILSGVKVAATQIIKLELNSITANVDIEGIITVFEEDTGTTPRLAAQSVGNVTVSGGIGGDLPFLMNKEFDGKLIHNLSAEFTTTGVKFTRTVASGKTFYLYKAMLLPKDNVQIRLSTGQNQAQARAEVKYDGAVIDVMMFDAVSDVSTGGSAEASVETGASEQQSTHAMGKSMDGDGVKVVEINIPAIAGGTFRVLMMGIEEDTTTDPRN